MLADRVRIGRKKEGIEYIGEVYLAQDDDFVKVNDRWVYRGSELEIEIPHRIQGEKVTSYDYMFYGTGSYLATPVTRVDSNNKGVTRMVSTFYNSSATTLDLSNFDTSNVTNMMNMFFGSSATTLDLSSFDTSNVIYMSSMFNTSSATTLNLSSFDTSKVTSMNGMFWGSQATTLDLSNFDTSEVTNMASMFYDSQVTSLDLSSFDTSNVTSIGSMFYNSSATTLDLSSFDTSKVTSMYAMFEGSKATTLDLSSFDTSKVISMNSMFYRSSATTGYARTQEDADRFNASSNKPARLVFVVGKFGEPILIEPGIFLNKWSAFGTGTGVGQVYDNRLYLSCSPNASVGDAAQFLSDPVKVSSNALSWLMTPRDALGGEGYGFYSSSGFLHGIPIGTIIKIDITLTCVMAAIPQILIPAKFDLEISIMDEYGGLLASQLIPEAPIELPLISIDSLKFT